MRQGHGVLQQQAMMRQPSMDHSLVAAAAPGETLDAPVDIDEELAQPEPRVAASMAIPMKHRDRDIGSLPFKA
jgi:hypothetical protein